jgi:hypothetical protein
MHSSQAATRKSEALATVQCARHAAAVRNLERRKRGREQTYTHAKNRKQVHGQKFQRQYAMCLTTSTQPAQKQQRHRASKTKLYNPPQEQQIVTIPSHGRVMASA